MALHITNSTVEQRVRDLASVTGESITDAIGVAVEERLMRVKPPKKQCQKPSVEEIMDLIHSFKLERINQDLTEDEILGYGPEGF